ncbi:MAG: glycoside hydrolase family 99-like domain-containing protein [Deltaproteobacteria bacterium]|nr:glycoside hydrolase family 99-like domain-containing protein [Deltaproteobacteria bacterium]
MKSILRNVMGIFKTYDFSQAIPNIRRYGLGAFLRNTAYELRRKEAPGYAARQPERLRPEPPVSASVEFVADSESGYVFGELSERIAEERAKVLGGINPKPKDLITVNESELVSVAGSIRFKDVNEPLVSIIIPAMNDARLTVECLLSVEKFTKTVPYEVIVVDDGSSDRTGDIISRIKNITCTRNPGLIGYARSCNKGADIAKGKYLVFLNSRMQVTQGWLTELVGTFEGRSSVGAAGAKIVNPNGRLQEVAVVINHDRTMQPVGRMDDPDLPRYSYVREVDFCSGACLAVEAEQFRAVGGFAGRFAPGYLEDADLQMRLREKGLRIFSNPGSVVIHNIAAASSGTDEPSSAPDTSLKLSVKWHKQVDELNKIRLIALYLPQFHPIPENDRWWGRGFTEWRNVARAQPVYEGHYQPHLPADLGFYDLRVPEVMEEQAALAKRYGLHGFCFYYYWFAGKRLLEMPLERMLETGRPDIPFCLCWANENWTRRWDGSEQEILMKQEHSEKHDHDVIMDVGRYLRHKNYIKVNGKPAFLVYRIGLFPDIKRTTDIWRDVCRREGIGEIYLVMVESFEHSTAGADPSQYGFDASMEFPPHQIPAVTVKPGKIINPNFTGVIYDYRDVALKYMSKKAPGHKRFRGVIMSWDNTARRPNNSHIFAHSSPEVYQEWLEGAIAHTREQNSAEERIVFINAWNEWAEGAHLEPDQRFGHGYLKATNNALSRYSPKPLIIVVTHDAHFHGAQLLALKIVEALSISLGCEVVTLLAGPGVLEGEFARYSTTFKIYSMTDGEKSDCIKELYLKGVREAICNTSVVGDITELLASEGFETVSLVHELTDYITANGLEGSLRKEFQYSKKVIFPAGYCKKAFMAKFDLDYNKALVRPQGIYNKNRYLSRRDEARAIVRKRLNLPASAKIVLNIAFGDSRKGLDIFVKTGLELIERFENVYFVWIGHYDERLFNSVSGLISKHGRQRHFLFPGLQKEIDLYYSGSDVFFLSSREDPFPAVVLDAMNAGLPVVGFEGAGGFCEILQNQNGVTVPAFDEAAAANAIEKLLSDADYRALISSNAVNAVARDYGFNEYVSFLLGTLREKKKISVIIPSYNYERYIEARLNTVINQTYKPYEIIFLDDASTDNSLERARRVLERSDVPFRIIESTGGNSGCYAQWLKGIRAAGGELIWIAESDDLCELDFLEKMAGAFNDSDAVLAYSQSQVIDENSNKLDVTYVKYTNDISESKWRSSYVEDGGKEIATALAIKNTIPNVSAVLMRKDILDKVGPDLLKFKTSGDWFVYVSMLKHGKVYFNSAVLNYHRRHSSSIIHRNIKNWDLVMENITILEGVLSEFRLPRESFEKAIKNIEYVYGLMGTDARSILEDPVIKDRVKGLYNMYDEAKKRMPGRGE